MSRAADKAKALTDKGAELFLGDSSNADFLTKAFSGATAAYVLIPPDWTAADFYAYQQKMADAIVTAVKNSGVKNVVSLSSIGTHIEEFSGVVYGLRVS
ncbi:MAG: NAD(P)H-binding protein [Marinilabiliales bacterium]|nr:NAD(P)H-binding protein [Marinilabiliales bacterium]